MAKSAAQCGPLLLPQLNRLPDTVVHPWVDRADDGHHVSFQPFFNLASQTIQLVLDERIDLNLVRIRHGRPLIMLRDFDHTAPPTQEKSGWRANR
jgi:hypothetical protein